MKSDTERLQIEGREVDVKLVPEVDSRVMSGVNRVRVIVLKDSSTRLCDSQPPSLVPTSV